MCHIVIPTEFLLSLFHNLGSTKLSVLFTDKLKWKAIVLKSRQEIGQAFKQTDLTIVSFIFISF